MGDLQPFECARERLREKKTLDSIRADLPHQTSVLGICYNRDRYGVDPCCPDFREQNSHFIHAMGRGESENAVIRRVI